MTRTHEQHMAAKHAKMAQRKAEEAAPVTSIDMTPTFEESVRCSIALLECGDYQGRKFAREELLRYGRELDRLKAASAGLAFDTADTPLEGE
jgi:hypothetical protein